MGWFFKCLRQYADFEGRAHRKELFTFCLFAGTLSAVGFYFHLCIGFACCLALLFPYCAVMVRRLHDIGRSGGLVFVLLALMILIVGAVGFSDVLAENEFFYSVFWSACFLSVFWSACFLSMGCLCVWVPILCLRKGEQWENKYGPDPKTSLEFFGDNQEATDEGNVLRVGRYYVKECFARFVAHVDNMDDSQCETTMNPPKIVLIGTEGAGKTVLVTVLAKKMAMPKNGVWFSHRVEKEVGNEMEKNWNTLRNGKWPPSTPAGTLFDLNWGMWIGGRRYLMNVVDSSGQDLRRLFNDDGFNAPHLSEQDRLFIDYIHNATILLVLVNLRDFLGEPDENKIIENAFTLKELLDHLKTDKKERQIAFLFTAYDQYEATIKENYGTVWDYFEQEFPYLYHAHVSGKPVKCFPVAAVAQTETRIGDDGTPQRVPARGFLSQGLEPFVRWLADTVSNAGKKEVKSNMIFSGLTKNAQIELGGLPDHDAEKAKGTIISK